MCMTPNAKVCLVTVSLNLYKDLNATGTVIIMSDANETTYPLLALKVT